MAASSVTVVSTTQSSAQPEGCLVLRVKRKREEDPAEALVVTKHTKLDASVAATSVFRFVGTLGEEINDKVILDRLKHYRDRTDHVKSSPFAKLSLEDTRAQAREAGKAHSSAQRFKVTSKLRCLQSSSMPDTVGTRNEGEGRGGESSVLAEERVHVCDAMQEEGEERQTVGAVTCNDTVMVRERVVKTEGYVYDLYYTREPGIISMEMATFDWSSLSVYESELVHDIIDSEEEVLEDEDDSNDEDNWRNDYPDEEESPHSSDSEQDDREEYRNWQDIKFYSSGEDDQ